MKIYSLMTGANFPGGAYHKEWIMAWVGLGIIALAIMISRKWLGEENPSSFEFNWYGSFLGILSYVMAVSFLGSAKISLLIGFAGFIFGGYGLGSMFGGAE